MNIKIPRPLVRVWDGFTNFGNVPALRFGRFELLRIDLLAVAFWVATIAWYGTRYGWRGALQGGVAFIVMGALALFVRPPATRNEKSGD